MKNKGGISVSKKFALSLLLVFVLVSFSSVAFADQYIFRSGIVENVGIGGTPAHFTTHQPVQMNEIVTYHFNFGKGAPAGTIFVYYSDGSLFGQYQAKGVFNSTHPENGASPPDR